MHPTTKHGVKRPRDNNVSPLTPSRLQDAPTTGDNHATVLQSPCPHRERASPHPDVAVMFNRDADPTAAVRVDQVPPPVLQTTSVPISNLYDITDVMATYEWMLTVYPPFPSTARPISLPLHSLRTQLQSCVLAPRTRQPTPRQQYADNRAIAAIAWDLYLVASHSGIDPSELRSEFQRDLDIVLNDPELSSPSFIRHQWAFNRARRDVFLLGIVIMVDILEWSRNTVSGTEAGVDTVTTAGSCNRRHDLRVASPTLHSNFPPNCSCPFAPRPSP